MGLPEITIHIYPTDCDMLGHVNHATMISFLEHARWALIEETRPLGDALKGDVWPVVRHVDISYHAQTLPGDDIVIRSGLVRIKNTSYIVRQDVRKKQDGTLVADATLVFVTIGRNGRHVPVPREWLGSMAHWPESEEPAAAPVASGAT